jgi:hypothetical protein
MGESERATDVRHLRRCHESPHKPEVRAFSRRVWPDSAAARLRPRVTRRSTCTWRESASILTPGQHAFAGFPLGRAALAASAASSATIPPPARSGAPPRSRRPKACSTCHADPHGGQFHSGRSRAQECTACHDPLEFEPHAFHGREGTP